MLRSNPSDAAASVRELASGEAFRLLEDSLGWAWGYAESDRRVGYVQSRALSPVS
ncbi:hypothetical protein [Sphingomonas sp.]|uniref:hypothetical protein n=1 Tax=Sphingomonas sp. TaxID=28214 RepID=UPI0025D8592F|nr:hypothetical protein [Sphingomonas sp.]MBV9527143.1 hypothetical protein [Sphingomonas sp.]